MGLKHLWDTNTVIYYLQKQFSQRAERFMDDALLQSDPALSIITEIELLCWKTATEKDLLPLKGFIGDSFVIGLEQAIKDKTIEIRKHYHLKLPDAIIASSAIVYDLHLITRNTKDFDRIHDLRIVNPFAV